MRIALCTTTIHVPHALKLMRKCSADVKFFIAGDKKTPREAYELVLSLENAVVCLPESGHKWKCSGTIGFDTLARRNIAFLEALKWGADVIYSWDNDNIPVDCAHFWALENHVFEMFSGIKVGVPGTWFNPGSLLVPAARHRGFPYNVHSYKLANPITDVKIGVAAGLVIGDPDIDATTRMEHRPDIGAVHILGQAGVVVDPNTWTVFNSQNTAVIRELIPAWFMAPGCGRHDDIFASLVVQRVMRERGYHAHFGPPFTLQQRNPHDLLVDLRAEIDGMSNVEKMADLLDSIPLPLKSVIGDTRIIYEALSLADWYPKQACVAAFAYLEDCESVL